MRTLRTSFWRAYCTRWSGGLRVDREASKCRQKVLGRVSCNNSSALQVVAATVAKTRTPIQRVLAHDSRLDDHVGYGGTVAPCVVSS